MTNIQKQVHQYIDHHMEIKKTLLAGLINISSLARLIASEENLGKNIDAVISGIRRYEGKLENKKTAKKLYSVIRNAKISTKTKLVSILVKRNDETEKQAGSIPQKLNLRRDHTLRTFEVINYIKILVDEELLADIKKLFSAKNIESVEKNLGEITLFYNEDITTIPGAFATLTNEMAMHDVTIIDSMICQKEHLIVVDQDELEGAMQVILRLTKEK